MIEIIPNWHSLFAHFTVLLLFLAVLFFIIEKPIHETIMGDNFLIFARYCLLLGVTFSFVTVLVGWSTYNSVDHDALSRLTMADHLKWALITFAIFIIAAIWLLASAKLKEGASILFLFVLIIGAGLLGVTGFKGAELVYKYGIGVKSMPTQSDHSSTIVHSHDHNDLHDNKPSAAQMDDHMTMDTISKDQIQEDAQAIEEMPIEYEEDGITRQKLAP